MSGRAGDERVVRALRDLLAELRPPGGAPMELRDSVGDIPSHPIASSVVGRVRVVEATEPVIAGLGVAAAFLLAMAVGVAQRIAVSGPGTTVISRPPTPGVDLTLDGLGLVPTATEEVGWVLAVIAVATIGFLAVAQRGARRVLLAMIAAAVAGSAVVLANQPRVDYGSWYGPVAGLDLSVEAPPGSDGPTVYYVTAEPNEPFAIDRKSVV